MEWALSTPTSRLTVGARARAPTYSPCNSGNRSGGTEQPQGPTDPVWGPVATETSTGSPQRGQSGNGDAPSSPVSASRLIATTTPRPSPAAVSDSRLFVSGDSFVVRDVYIPVE